MKTRMAFAATLLAGTASSAFAAPSCTAEALNALHVASVTVTEAAPVAATGGAPAYCDVKGTVVTQGEGAPNGSARFAMQLPDDWRQRFFFMGVGGNAGTLTPAVNAIDRASSLGKGYVTAVTDTGHVGNGTDASWVRMPTANATRRRSRTSSTVRHTTSPWPASNSRRRSTAPRYSTRISTGAQPAVGWR